MPHVDDGTLHALLDGALRAEEPDRADRVEAHLDACADCRARLERAAALKDRASRLLDAMDATGAGTTAPADTTAPDAVPDFQEVLDRARAHDSAAGPGRAGPSEDRRAAIARQYRWTRGLAWAATIVVALGTGYLVRGLVGPEGLPEVQSTPLRSGNGGSGSASRATPVLDTGGPGGSRDRAPAEAPEPGGADLVAPELVAPAAGLHTAEATPATGEQERAAGQPRSAQEQATRPAAEADLAAQDRAARNQAAMQAEPAGQPLAEAGLASAAPDSAAADSTVWRSADLAEAEARVGPILVLPGARLVGAELAEGDEAAVRTLQRLGDVDVRVVQRVEGVGGEAAAADAEPGAPTMKVAPAPEAARAPTMAARERPVLARDAGELRAQARTFIRGDDPVLIGVRMDSVAATVAEPQTVTVLQDSVSLTVTGRLTPDLLRALAAAATPRAP